VNKTLLAKGGVLFALSVPTAIDEQSKSSAVAQLIAGIFNEF